MKLIRFLDSRERIGFAARTPAGDFRLEGDVFGAFHITQERVQVARLLAPIAPTQILAIGLNYRQNAHESGVPAPEFPVVFTKFLGSLNHPGAPIVLPQRLPSDSVDFEAELAVVIGRECRNATRETALDFVLGYTCANDISARDWQFARGGTQWGRAKSFDSFCPLGPALTLKDEIQNPNALAITTVLNGQTVQNSNTRDMIFDVPAIIEFLSADSTLPQGTVILTGTPQGVGMARTPPLYLQSGDEITVEIEKIGALSNAVQTRETTRNS